MTFTDNSAILDLLERKPNGIFSLLDEACLFPQATDESFLNKCNNAHGNKTALYKLQSSKSQKGSFTIVHSASDVSYNANGFLEKNKDKLRSNLCHILEKSTSELVATLFPFISNGANTTGKLTGASAFLSSKFRESMSLLRKELESTSPNFIRCLKSNNSKKPKYMDQALVLHQLRYLGVLDSIRVNQAGFSSRQTYAQFYSRFFMVDANALTLDHFSNDEQLKDGCEELARFMWQQIAKLADTLSFQKHVQFGNTLVFMRSDTLQAFEAFRKARLVAQEQAATTIQSLWRMRSVKRSLGLVRRAIRLFVCKWRFRVEREAIMRRKEAAVLLTRCAKMSLQRKRFHKKKCAIIRVQSVIRRHHAVQAFAKTRDALQLVRLMFQGRLIRLRIKRKLAAVGLIQDIYRKHAKKVKRKRKRMNAASLLQATFRGWAFRRRHATLIALLVHAKATRHRGYAARSLQAVWRGYLIRRRMQELKDAAMDMQQWCRFVLQRKLFQMQRVRVRILQRVIRGYMARRRAHRLRTTRLLEIERSRLALIRHAELVSSLKCRPEPPAVNTIPLPGATRSSQKAFVCKGAVDGFRAFEGVQVVDVDVLTDVSSIFPRGIISEVMKLEDRHGGVKRICMGTSHVVLLLEDGMLFSFGYNERGQCGYSSRGPVIQPKAILFGSERYLGFKLPIKCIAVGNEHTLALTKHGKVYAWGDGSHGQLGNGKFTNSTQPLAVEVFKSRKVQAIACGAYHSVALMFAGSVYTWGGSGRVLGLGVQADAHKNNPRPSAIKSLIHEYVANIAAGTDFTLALTGAGNVYAWGENAHGQLGLGDKRCRFRPVLVLPSGMEGVRTIQIKCGAYHALLLNDEGHVFVWGSNSSGQLGLGDLEDRHVPTRNRHVPQAHYAIDHIACGWRQTALLHENKVYVCGPSSASVHQRLQGSIPDTQMRRILEEEEEMENSSRLMPQVFTLRRSSTATSIDLSVSNAIGFLSVAYKQRASARRSSFDRPFFYDQRRESSTRNAVASKRSQPSVTIAPRTSEPAGGQHQGTQRRSSRQANQESHRRRKSLTMKSVSKKRSGSAHFLGSLFDRKYLCPSSTRSRVVSEPIRVVASSTSPQKRESRAWYMRSTENSERARRDRGGSKTRKKKGIEKTKGVRNDHSTRNIDAELEQLLLNIQERAWSDVETLLRSREKRP